jgi:hypothetical protein
MDVQACSFLAIAQIWSDGGHDFLALQAFFQQSENGTISAPPL